MTDRRSVPHPALLGEQWHKMARWSGEGVLGAGVIRCESDKVIREEQGTLRAGCVWRGLEAHN